MSTRNSQSRPQKSFWKKVRSQAKRAGKRVIETALTLYYAWQDTDTPKGPKAVIVAALTYFVSPIDAVPDPVPGIGYGDDILVLLRAFAVIAAHIKPDHRELAKRWVEAMFGKS